MIAVCYVYPDKYIAGILFCIGDEHIKIFIVIEYTGIEDLKFRFMFGTDAVFLNELLIRECLLRIFVEVLHVIVCRNIIQVIIQFFHVLPMISLTITQSK